jgi:hypothetical protein
MEYADNVYTVVQRHVEDDVAAERQAADTRCELITLSSHQVWRDDLDEKRAAIKMRRTVAARR